MMPFPCASVSGSMREIAMAIFHQLTLKRLVSRLEYRGIWIVFCVLWFLLGAAIAGYPVRVARLLGRKGGDMPPSRFLTAGTPRHLQGRGRYGCYLEATLTRQPKRALLNKIESDRNWKDLSLSTDYSSDEIPV